ncbi:MAG: phosphate ABC transporter substrate-binding protein [Candidatus Altiarchaeia archaeon]
MKAFVALLIAGLVLSSGCVNKDTGADLVIAGSTTVQPIVAKASEVFAEKNKGVAIGVQGGGSGTGIRMVGEGSVAIGASSRELNSEEKTKHPDLVTSTVGIDCIAVVVHPSNSLGNTSFSIEQIRDVFSGRITNYKELGGPDRTIVLVQREDGSGTRSMFESLVMNNSEVSDAALQKPASGAIRFTVSNNENAIGYVGIGYLDGTITPVAINGALPTEENVRANRYPLARNLYLITKGAPEGLAKEFIGFILSPGGQKIVKEEGFIGIK